MRNSTLKNRLLIPALRSARNAFAFSPCHWAELSRETSGRIRLERGLTQEELAVRVRINRNYVGMIERQENSPTVAMLERIAKALGIEPARLFDEKAAGWKGE